MTDDTKNCPGGDKMLLMLIMQTICGFFATFFAQGEFFVMMLCVAVL